MLKIYNMLESMKETIALVEVLNHNILFHQLVGLIAILDSKVWGILKIICNFRKFHHLIAIQALCETFNYDIYIQYYSFVTKFGHYLLMVT